MIRHVVCWTFHETADGRSRADNIAEAARRLAGLRARIPVLRSLEVGVHIGAAAEAFDLALLCSFDSLADLEIYQRHPAHQEVVAFLRQVRDRRVVVDFEI